MAEKTNCPACGAPLDVSADQETIRCDFCGDSFDVGQEDGDLVLNVRDQPSPQRETMSRAAGEVSEAARREAAEDLAARSPGTVPPAKGEAVAPNFATAGSEQADPNALEPDAVLPQPPDNVDTIPQTEAHYQVGSEPPRTTNNANRWIVIGISVFVVVCLLCLCVAGAALIISGGEGIRF